MAYCAPWMPTILPIPVTPKAGWYVVQIAHADSPERDAAIHAIVAEYERRFQQEAVMRLRSATCVSF